ncbi:glycoside hydrolase family 95 protein [Clostridium sp.]|uniref:glycoside hydrolase family 95 protein n=1 Tax=Clostridium sp. TaxID=1506 RepID=UPI001DC72882|nr:glycoside hydrolase family 95 protein [Clostridium sp.]MBS5936952.1 glycoside hydrolase family 95 protein [Clostridium sp.]
MNLWYRKPAENWNEALPLGNGKIGGMVYGNIVDEQISLNDEGLWYGGGDTNRNNPDSLKNLGKIRELLFNGEVNKAEELAKLSMYGTPRNMRHYETLGDLYIKHKNINENEVENYRRGLDINNAIAWVEYEFQGISYKREYFISHVDGAMIIKYTSSEKKALNLTINLDRKKKFLDKMEKLNENAIMMSGVTGGKKGLAFNAACKLIGVGGEIYTIGETIVGENLDEAVIVFSSDTDYSNDDPKNTVINRLYNIEYEGYDVYKNNHIKDYQRYFHNMKLKFEGKAYDDLPTDERLNLIKEGKVDIGLINLYFHYGRYLLISCSRPGGLAANLQGIWCDDIDPIWGSKYTININIQMNYWLTGPCGLLELNKPLFDLIDNMRENGRITARQMYNSKGFVAHHNTDAFGDTAPQSHTIAATIWPLGAAWLCTHIWEHYLFSLDKEFLKEYYPIMKESAEFFEDYLVENKEGYLVTGPSVSPENTFILDNGQEGNLCMGPTMDIQILRLLFTDCIEASKCLNIDSEFRNKLEVMIGKLPPTKIGKYGQIQEWAEDYEEKDLGHRHVSQLFGLHPSNEISLEKTPKLAKAAKATLERRLKNGGGHTGWSRAWMINFWARLQESEKLFNDLQSLLSNSTMTNLLDNHPPFQIDGNFGAVAGICEMLLQSQNGILEILPSIPEKLKDGEVMGINGRGNFELDFKWVNGKITYLKVKGRPGSSFKLKIKKENSMDGNDINKEVVINNNGEYILES